MKYATYYLKGDVDKPMDKTNNVDKTLTSSKR